ncbi:hypothetical protein QL285_016202 [Trifolium repens]|nr:hypothetical protein QL285_016202 [Trifolium repens]
MLQRRDQAFKMQKIARDMFFNFECKSDYDRNRTGLFCQLYRVILFCRIRIPVFSFREQRNYSSVTTRRKYGFPAHRVSAKASQLVLPLVSFSTLRNSGAF